MDLRIWEWIIRISFTIEDNFDRLPKLASERDDVLIVAFVGKAFRQIDRLCSCYGRQRGEESTILAFVLMHVIY